MFGLDLNQKNETRIQKNMDIVEPDGSETTLLNDSENPPDIVNSMNEFGFKLFKVFASRHKMDSTNMCFAPLEIFNSFVKLLLGASGKTKVQLEEMLCVSDFNDTEKYEDLIDLIKWIIKSNHEIMVYGTVMYVDERVQLKPEYLQLVKDIFEIKPKFVDFNNIDEAVYTINKDAYDITDGLIEGVISRNDLREESGNVKLIISNAVFFRGYWLFKFGDIQKEPFYYARGTKTAPIDLMSHTGNHRYCYEPELRAHTVSIAYVASDIRMVIIMPENLTDEAVYLIDLLNAQRIRQLFYRLQNSPKSRLELTIPRFAMDAHKVSLQKTIKTLGATSIYDPKESELTGICANGPIHLTKIVHKAFILVDERGSLIPFPQSSELRTFMTQMESEPRLAQQEVKTFKANHPFMFVIIDKITSVVCFLGLFSDPRNILEVVNEDQLSNAEIAKLLRENDQKDLLNVDTVSNYSQDTGME